MDGVNGKRPRLTTEEFFLAFWLRCHGNGASQKQDLKNGFCLFKKNPVVRISRNLAKEQFRNYEDDLARRI